MIYMNNSYNRFFCEEKEGSDSKLLNYIFGYNYWVDIYLENLENNFGVFF